MAKSHIYVGLEIGTSKICMVVGEVKPDETCTILGVGETRSAGIRKGEIIDAPHARTGIREALIQAEEICDVNISTVLLSITGSHIIGENNRGTYRLPDDENEIQPHHVKEASDIAQDLVIPSDHKYIHSFISNYRLDDQEQHVVPLGMMGRTLEVDYHIVHGKLSRVQNSIKAVRESLLEVDSIVFAPIASAQVALDRQDKDAGALVIDMGGGTTDYVLYLNGVIVASGCIPVGGDHVTNDIHLITKIPFLRAEELKKTEGDASGDPARGVGSVKVIDDHGYDDVEIERKVLNDIIYSRLEDTLVRILNRLPENSIPHIGSGVFITGGASNMRGLYELAAKIFNLPVYPPRQSEHSYMSGVYANFRDPQYSTAVGLIRYAQILAADREADNLKGIISKTLRTLWPF